MRLQLLSFLFFAKKEDTSCTADNDRPTLSALKLIKVKLLSIMVCRYCVFACLRIVDPSSSFPSFWKSPPFQWRNSCIGHPTACPLVRPSHTFKMEHQIHFSRPKLLPQLTVKKKGFVFPTLSISTFPASKEYNHHHHHWFFFLTRTFIAPDINCNQQRKNPQWVWLCVFACVLFWKAKDCKKMRFYRFGSGAWYSGVSNLICRNLWNVRSLRNCLDI